MGNHMMSKSTQNKKVYRRVTQVRSQMSAKGTSPIGTG